MTSHMIPPVLPGDELPFLIGLAADGRFFSLEEQTGRPAAVLLLGAEVASCQCMAFRQLAQHADDFVARGADILVVLTAAMLHQAASQVPAGLACKLVPCDADYLARCGVAPHQTVVLAIDRNRRVAFRKPFLADHDVVATCLEHIMGLPAEHPHGVSMPAPVLIVPNLLPPPVCRFLVDQFDSRPTFESAVASVDAAGKPCSRVDHAKKMRRDMLIAPEEPLHDILREAILRRAAPQMARAFHADVAHIDRLLVARYEANAGWFHRHRDDLARHVAFREFAVSINLGAEPFEGGDLMFPEYNDHRYRPPLGAALIFSGSLLHQVTPVTQGRRTVLLTFLHGEAAEARRLARGVDT